MKYFLFLAYLSVQGLMTTYIEMDSMQACEEFKYKIMSEHGYRSIYKNVKKMNCIEKKEI